MLLGPATYWLALNDGSFDVRLTNAHRTVTGRVFVDDRGAPYDFSTTDRYTDLPGELVRAEWRTPVRGWEVVDGRAVPGMVEAVWLLPSGPEPYFTGPLSHVVRNVSLDH